MKNFHIFFLFLLLLVGLSSCKSKYTHHPIILRAEKLLDTSPDSAFKLLSSISHPEKMPESDYAAWCLHYTHACYKLEYTIKSDSLINLSVDYYADGALPVYAGTAYYLKGCVSDLNIDYENAMRAYKRGEQQLLKTNKFNLLGLIYFNMGYIFKQDEVFEKSLICYRSAKYYFNKSGNGKNEAYAYKGMANLLAILDLKQDSVLLFFEKAIDLSLLNGDSINYYNTLSEFATILLYRTNKFELAKDYSLSAYYSDKKNITFSKRLAFAYAKLNRPDSAQFYFEKTVGDTIDFESKSSTYYTEAYVAKSQGNLVKAFDCYKLYEQYRDSIVNLNKTSQLYKIDKQYDLSQKERENANLKIQRRNLAVLVSALTVLLLILILYFQTLRFKRRKVQLKAEFETKSLRTLTGEQRSRLLLQMRNNINNTLLVREVETKYANTDKLNEALQLILYRNTITDETWVSLVSDINKLYSGFIDQLSNRYSGLTNLDLKVLALVRMELSITDSCTLLDMSKSTMYQRRKRIKERIGLEDLGDLDGWVMEQFPLKR